MHLLLNTEPELTRAAEDPFGIGDLGHAANHELERGRVGREQLLVPGIEENVSDVHRGYLENLLVSIAFLVERERKVAAYSSLDREILVQFDFFDANRSYRASVRRHSDFAINSPRDLFLLCFVLAELD